MDGFGKMISRASCYSIVQTLYQEFRLPPCKEDRPSLELLSCMIRRAASFLCPTSRSSVVDQVVTCCEGLFPDLEELGRRARDTVDELISYGDLLELQDATEEHAGRLRRRLHCRPPSFVSLKSGLVFLVGIGPDNSTGFTEDLWGRVIHRQHVRFLRRNSLEDGTCEILQTLGYVNLTPEEWLKTPRSEQYAQCIARHDSALHKQPQMGEVGQLTILDWNTPVRYYVGRWKQPNHHTGNYVARRERAFGAPLWAYVTLRDGQVQNLLDLPALTGDKIGCDAAWRLQAAIDASRGNPQIMTVSPCLAGSVFLRFYSPLPSWATRRLDMVGERTTPSHGCLIAFQVPAQHVEEEKRFVAEKLWMKVTAE